MVPKIIEDIRNNTELSPFLVNECSENGVYFTVSQAIDRDRYEMIKVDDYYNSLEIKKIPKSVDCLIVQVCNSVGRILHLIELKSYSTSEHLNIKALIEKFNSTISDFIEFRFNEPIGKYDYNDFNPVLISKIQRRDRSLKLALLMDNKYKIQFRGVKYIIRVKANGTEIIDC